MPLLREPPRRLGCSWWSQCRLRCKQLCLILYVADLIGISSANGSNWLFRRPHQAFIPVKNSKNDQSLQRRDIAQQDNTKAAGTGKLNQKGKKHVSAGAGFGPEAKGVQPTFEDRNAASLLQLAGGDINAAQALHFQQSIDRLKYTDAKMYSALEGIATRQRNGRNELGAETDVEVLAAREKLVELTFESVASFMRVERGTSSKKNNARKAQLGVGVNAEVREKLRRIANACCADIAHWVNGRRPRSQGLAVLDVGCGDGAMVPYLEEAGVGRYVGLDLSHRMVQRARRIWTEDGSGMAREFYRASFLDVNEGSEFVAGGFDAVLFNGSLQFFGDIEGALARAKALLRRHHGSVNGGDSGDNSSSANSSDPGRIVVAHVNGGSFVRTEHTGNPLVAVSIMPSPAEVQAALDRIGNSDGHVEQNTRLRAFTERELAADGELPVDLEKFYLCICA